MDGHFSLDVDRIPATLIISYIGYGKQEIKATAGKILKVVMAPDNNVMEEVVVTGYGTFKKSAYAGSASTVKADKMKDIPAVSFKDLLQGNAPGVQFSSSSGQPGASSSLNIRGMASLMIVMFSISELLIVDIMSRPASELIVLIEPERIGIPSITYNGELLALKMPLPPLSTVHVLPMV